MNPKTKAIWAAIVSALSGFISWLANTPPSQQDAVLGPLVDLLPLHWRPIIGAGMKMLSGVAGIYATMQAAHSGPANQPPTQPLPGAIQPVTIKP